MFWNLVSDCQIPLDMDEPNDTLVLRHEMVFVRPRTHQIVVIRIFQNLTCFIVFGDGCQIYYKLARFWSILKSLTLTENDNLKS